MRTVLAFGTFDHLHPGHLAFLERVRALGDRLVVGVARDEHVRSIKNKEPKQNEETRRSLVAELPYVDEAILCDETLGTYEILARVQPDVVAFGYDQSALQEDIARHLADQENSNIELIRIAHKEALQREVSEETGLTILSQSLLGVHTHDWTLPDTLMRVHLHLFHCFVGEGDIAREERSCYQHVWVPPTEALTYDLLAANADLLKKFYLDKHASHLGGN